MAFTVSLSVNSLGNNTGPFYVYSDADGYQSLLAIVTQAQLLGGVSVVVPNGTTTVLLSSVGTCGTELYVSILNLPTPTPTPTATPSTTPSLTPSLTPTITPTRSVMANIPIWPTPSRTPVAGIPNTCLTHNTSIIMADGTIKPVQDVRVGDTVLSVSDKEDFFNTNKFEKNIATVVGTYSILVHDITSINNGLLKTSNSHVNVIKRDNIWSLKTSKELLVGDIIIDINGNEIEITSVENISESQLVYNITVDKEHLYFANNILTHNKPAPPNFPSYICCGTLPGSGCSWHLVATSGATCASLGLFDCTSC